LSERAAGDAGYMTVVALGLAAVVVAAGLAAVLVAEAVIARHRAAGAADLAALAGAGAVLAGPTAACSAAAAVAHRNGARLTGCAVSGALVRVRASVDYPWSGVVPLARAATATAVAGPLG
jgi:secretion/DNA translocation related TadE-like protein